MATLLSSIITMSRDRLNEPVPAFWSNAELLRYGNRGIRDLWRKLKLTNQAFFHQISVAATMPANGDQLTGVPTNCTTVHGLEPATLTDYPGLFFKRADYAGKDFANARLRSAITPGTQGGVIFYHVTQAGAPVAAPVILVAPRISAALLIRLTFTPTVGAELIATDPNPIPGESDNAVMHWIVAYAKGRQTKSGQPDANELALYEKEATSITVSESPRDDSEPIVAEAMFEEYW